MHAAGRAQIRARRREGLAGATPFLETMNRIEQGGRRASPSPAAGKKLPRGAAPVVWCEGGFVDAEGTFHPDPSDSDSSG
jgi:hypothetical protein